MEFKPDWRHVVIGAALIGYGMLFLAERVGVLPAWAEDFRWWPLIVIVIGVSKLIQPRGAESLGSAVTLTFLGLWFLVVANDWFGLTWRNSWPLALIAAGAGMIVRSLAGHWIPDKPVPVWKEENRA